MILVSLNIHFLISCSCQVGLKGGLYQLKDTCSRKVGQRLGMPLMGGWGYPWALFHTSISVYSGPLLSRSKPPQAKMMSRYRHTLRRKQSGGKVHNCCFRGVSRLMNVCSVLITTLDYLNPPYELRPVTRTKGSERSKIKPSPLLAPKIMVSSLNHSHLSIFPFSPSFSLHLPPCGCSLHPLFPSVCCSFVFLSPCSSALLNREDGSLSPCLS